MRYPCPLERCVCQSYRYLDWPLLCFGNGAFAAAWDRLLHPLNSLWPFQKARKNNFLVAPETTQTWLILGDFNVIYRARDKNNNNLNLRLMRKFRAALNFCQLKEIHLQNRKYTWSNERRCPTLVCLDRIFCNVRWDLAFENHSLHALSSSHSDHCPVLLAHQNGLRKPTPFKFENFWTKLPHFQDVVTAAWSQPTTHTEPFHRLSHKLHITGKALRKWSRSLISDAKLKLHMAQEVILRLDVAQENRDLSESEHCLRNKLKKHILGWAVF